MEINTDLLWDILREQNCATKPFDKATCIVMLKKPQLKDAIAEYKRRLNVNSR